MKRAVLLFLLSASCLAADKLSLPPGFTYSSALGFCVSVKGLTGLGSCNFLGAEITDPEIVKSSSRDAAFMEERVAVLITAAHFV